MKNQEDTGAQRRAANGVSSEERRAFLAWLSKQEDAEILATKQQAMLAVWDILTPKEMDALVAAWLSVSRMMDNDDGLIEELLVATLGLVDTKMEEGRC